MLFRFLLRLKLNLEKEEKGNVLQQHLFLLSVPYHTPVIPQEADLGNLHTAMDVFVDNY